MVSANVLCWLRTGPTTGRYDVSVKFYVHFTNFPTFFVCLETVLAHKCYILSTRQVTILSRVDHSHPTLPWPFRSIRVPGQGIDSSQSKTWDRSGRERKGNGHSACCQEFSGPLCQSTIWERNMIATLLIHSVRVADGGCFLFPSSSAFSFSLLLTLLSPAWSPMDFLVSVLRNSLYYPDSSHSVLHGGSVLPHPGPPTPDLSRWNQQQRNSPTSQSKSSPLNSLWNTFLLWLCFHEGIISVLFPLDMV